MREVITFTVLKSLKSIHAMWPRQDKAVWRDKLRSTRHSFV